MILTLSINEAADRLPDLVAGLRPDDKIVLTRDGRSLASIVPAVGPALVWLPASIWLFMHDRIAAGVVLCPEDRKKEGIIPCRSVLENINLSARRRTAHGGVIISETWERENAARWIERPIQTAGRRLVDRWPLAQP